MEIIISLSLLAVAVLGVVLYRSVVSGQKEYTRRLLAEERATWLESENTRLQKEIKDAEASKSEALDAQKESLELLAHRIMEEQGKELRETNQREISQLLDPLKTEIGNFKSKVEECYSNEARERFSLGERIKELTETSGQVEREARQLSSALRGNTKFQGDWGELVLETILDNTNLRKDFEYMVQMSTDNSGNTIKNDGGNVLRPDVVVKYPDLGYIVIDSKVSLTAYSDYINEPSGEKKDELGKKHLMSLTKHIKELADKSYQDYVGSLGKLDFVIMFIASEGAYSTALQLEPGLWQKAYEKRVLLASPTQLVGALRLIEQMWRHDSQTRNAIEIATQSGQLYDKLAAFVDDLMKVQRNLRTSSDSLDVALSKLSTGRGNLLRRAEKIRKLGAETSKKMPKIADSQDDSEDDD